MRSSYEMHPHRQALLDRDVIDLNGRVDEPMVEYVRDCFAQLVGRGSPDITVIISSEGGLSSAGFHIYDMVRLYPGKTTGIVVKEAHSMAVIVLQACAIRKAAKHAVIFVHEIELSGVSIHDLEQKLEKMKQHLLPDQEHQIEILQSRTGKNRRAIVKQCRSSEKMTAEKALSFGLVDEII